MYTLNRIIIFFVAILLCGCSRSNKAGQKQVLRINMQHNPLSIDPRRGGDLASSSLHFMLFEGLTKITPDSASTKALASSISLSSDRKTITFKIRKTKWSNGDTVTSYDFAEAWKSILKPDFPSPHGNLFYSIKNAKRVKRGEMEMDELGIYTPNASTLVIELDKPAPHFFELTSFSAFFPVPSKIVKENDHWTSAPYESYVCNGPFKLKSYKHDHEMVLEKNPHYWNANSIHLDEIRISFVNSETTALDMFEKGEIDILGPPLTNIPIEAVGKCKFDARFSIRPIVASTGVFFNTLRFPFTNLKMRKAFSYAINRKSLTDTVCCFSEATGVSMLPPPASLDVEEELLHFGDVAVAKSYFEQGLKELGITREELPRMTLLYSVGETQHQMAQILQQFWSRAFDIPISIENAEFLVFINRLVNNDYLIGQGRWTLKYQDPLSFLERYAYKEEPKNFTNWESNEFSSLLQRSSFEKSERRRRAVLKRAAKILMDEVPLTVLFHQNSALLINPRVQGFYISPLGFLHFDNAKIIPSSLN